VNKARDAKDTLGILFWGVMHKRFGDLVMSSASSAGYDGLPMQPVAPPSPDYVPGPEHPPSPDYVPSPEHPPSPVKDGDDEPFDDDDDDTNDKDEEPFEYENDGEEEERLALADSSTIPTVDHVPSVGDTDALKTDEAAPTLIPSPRWHMVMISVRPQTPIPFPSKAEVEILLALPIPPPSPLSPWDSLSAALGQIQALQARDQTHTDDHEGAGSSA
ncbi:hypothetical protein Tco_0922927, partial [Tanacetum coccineum]